MDAFLGRTKYDSFLGVESLHLRAWLPLNHRAFIAAIEQYYQVPKYVASTGDKRLIGVMDGIIEPYTGERGFMGTHRYKVYGFLEVVAKTGRTETHGNAGSGDSDGRPWEEVHRTLSDSMIERLDPYRSSISLKLHEMRGCFEECRFMSRIIGREYVDEDKDRTTGKVSIDLKNTGITYGPGDRLAIMPLNPWSEVVKVAQVLRIVDRLDEVLSLEKAEDWKQFSKHMADVSRDKKAGEFAVRDILRRGHLAPLKETVMAVHISLRTASTSLLEVLSSDTWPVSGSLGDLLNIARSGVSPNIWDSAFSSDLGWLPKLVPVEVPRTYSISSYSSELLPSVVDLTVSRVEHKLCPLLAFDGSQDILRSGISSGFLNPHPSEEDESTIPRAIKCSDDDTVLIGISRPLSFQPPISPATPIA
jgi:sulfite reductase alpha subunit-like flavoprotein